MKNKLGFTLLELLVVVLIIGILASIALPQYQLSVGRSRLSELKIRANAIAEAGHMYVLEHDGIPEEEQQGTLHSLDLSRLNTEFPEDDISCDFYGAGDRYITVCSRVFSGAHVGYVIRNLDPFGCRVVGTQDSNHIASKLCEQDTGDANPDCGLGDEDQGRCFYHYQ